MARISKYAIDSNITGIDKLVGTDADDNDITKNFEISDLTTYISEQLLGSGATTIDGNLVVQGDTTTTGDLEVQNSSSVTKAIINNLEGYTTQLEFQQSNVAQWSLGQTSPLELDGRFSISQSGTLGTNEYFSISQTLGMKAKIGGTAGANELDDYEEGTYNLTFDDANSTDAWNATNWVSSGGTTFTNSSKYVKVGRQVTLFIDLFYRGKPTDMTDTPIRLSNLPFTVASAGGGTFTFDLVETLSSSQKPTLFGMAGLLVWYHAESVINFYNQTSRQDGGWGTSSTMDADNFPTTGQYGELANKRFTGTFTYYTNQ